MTAIRYPPRTKWRRLFDKISMSPHLGEPLQYEIATGMNLFQNVCLGYTKCIGLDRYSSRK